MFVGIAGALSRVYRDTFHWHHLVFFSLKTKSELYWTLYDTNALIFAIK